MQARALGNSAIECRGSLRAWVQLEGGGGGCFPIDQIGADMGNPRTMILNLESRYTLGAANQISCISDI